MNIVSKFNKFNIYQLKAIPSNPSPPNPYFPLISLPPQYQKIDTGIQGCHSSNTGKKCHQNLSSYCGNTLGI